MSEHAAAIQEAKRELLRAVGLRLRDAREYCGLTQSAAAAAVGVVRSQIANIEAGRSDIPLSRLMDFAELYEREPGWFLPDRLEVA